jgi:hypothetical protein
MVHLAAARIRRQRDLPWRRQRSPCPDGRLPSVGRHASIRRNGWSARLPIWSALQPVDAPDRPALGWITAAGVRYPLGVGAATGRAAAALSAFWPAEGESLHQIPVGPVHAGIIEPGHFRFTANGEAVVRLEERLGYVHKGIEA